MNIKPLADRVLVLPAPAEEKIGGIICKRETIAWQGCCYGQGHKRRGDGTESRRRSSLRKVFGNRTRV